MTQHCDSTCHHCAAEFWRWLAARNRRPKTGRSGPGDFYQEAVVSRERFRQKGDDMPQELLFVSDWRPMGMTRGADAIALAAKPTRVWTLYRHTDPATPPELPYDPHHGKNAFLEDEQHDWNWHNGVFKYRSRVANSPVWLLLEYKE
jgi:hypothetical protein